MATSVNYLCLKWKLKYINPRLVFNTSLQINMQPINDFILLPQRRKSMRKKLKLLKENEHSWISISFTKMKLLFSFHEIGNIYIYKVKRMFCFLV